MTVCDGTSIPPEWLTLWRSPLPSPQECLAETDVLCHDDPVVSHFVARLRGRSDHELVAAAFRLVRDGIRYDFAPDLGSRQDWSSARTVARGTGFCQQKAVVLAAVLRRAGIPAALGFEDLWDAKIQPPFSMALGGQVVPMHGLVLVYVDEQWVRADPCLDRALCDRKGYHVAEYRPSVGACLPAVDQAGRPHFRVVRELGAYPDLPEDIVDNTVSLPCFADGRWAALARRSGASM